MAMASLSSPARTDFITLLAIYALGLYLIGKMFYVFSGGTTQPADIALAAVVLVASPPRTILRLAREQMFLVLLVLWILIVNVSWMMATAKNDFILSALYYVFNFFIVVAVLSARERNEPLFDRVIASCVLISIAIQFLIVVFDSGAGRSLGTFRNPNQLAYWGVSVLGILLVIRGNKTKLIDLPFLAMVSWCELAAASRAGLVATALLILVWVFFALETPFKRVMGLLGAALLGVGMIMSSSVNEYFYQSQEYATTEARIAATSRSSDLDERNYSRIANHYQNIVFGAGEGYLSRFKKGFDDSALEIHSSLGTLLFSYGIFGLVLYIFFIGRLALSLPIGMAVYLLPSIVYGLTHQGLRFSFFWVLVGLLVSIASRRTKPVAERPAAAAPPTTKQVTSAPRDSEFLIRVARSRSNNSRIPTRPSP